MPVKLKVNGKVHTLDAAADTPLLWALRDILHLHGTKYGCGAGVCGACTVHLNGKAVRSCQTPISDAAGKEVVTIEGLSATGTHPLQMAWKDLDVPQCGYCQAGQILSAAALLKDHPKPTDAQIDEAMSGNLCRCGTYPAIRAAIHRAAGNKQTATGGSAITEVTNSNGGKTAGIAGVPAPKAGKEAAK